MQSRAQALARRWAAAAAPAAPLRRAMSSGTEVANATGAPVDTYYAGKERVVAGPMQRLRQSEQTRGRRWHQRRLVWFDPRSKGKEAATLGQAALRKRSPARAPARTSGTWADLLLRGGMSRHASRATRSPRLPTPQLLAPHALPAPPIIAAADRLSYLYLMEDMWRGIFMAGEVALKPKVRRRTRRTAAQACHLLPLRTRPPPGSQARRVHVTTGAICTAIGAGRRRGRAITHALKQTSCVAATLPRRPNLPPTLRLRSTTPLRRTPSARGSAGSTRSGGTPRARSGA